MAESIKKRIVTSWDDGSIYDLRVAELCSKYKIPAIFYISSNATLSEAEIKDLSQEFEIGGHTVSHVEDLKRLDPSHLFMEINDNRGWLKEISGQEVTSFAYPSGRYNDRVISAVKGSGFLEARTTVVGNIRKPEDQYRIQTTVHALDGRKEYEGKAWFQYALKKLSDPSCEYFHLWGHSWEVNQYEGWSELEVLFKILREHHL